MNNQHNLPSSLVWPGAEITLAVFTFPLSGITPAGRSLLGHVKEHPWLYGVSAVLIVGGILFLTMPIIVGFASTGPVEGSLAAIWQGWIGNVVKGSLFAVLQSLAMTGVFDTIGEAMIAAGIVGGTIPVGSGGSRNYAVAVPAAVFAAYMGFRGI